MEEENKEPDNAKSEEKITSKKKMGDLTNKLRANPFILSTVVCGVLVVILLIVVIGNGIAGNAVSTNVIKSNFLDFASSQLSNVEITDVERQDDLYKISFTSTEISDSSVYTTLNGKYMISGGLIPLVSSTPSTNTNTQTDIPKSDKPEVELFIWGYCPYGVQAQGPLAEVVSILGDFADFKTVLYYDGHGAYETQQNKIQECIQEIAPDKYWNYAAGFVEGIYPVCGSSKDVDCDKTESVKLMKTLGIDSDAVLSCVNTKGEDLLSTASARSKELGVTGSPTLVINGVKANPSSRTADAFKASICSAFNNAPEICGTELSSEAGTASGSC